MKFNFELVRINSDCTHDYKVTVEKGTTLRDLIDYVKSNHQTGKIDTNLYSIRFEKGNIKSNNFSNDYLKRKISNNNFKANGGYSLFNYYLWLERDENEI